MVEVDIQFLAGVAVTVFLALLFFGVVVLWDVALALRSVGDKIDKLEDSLDDDLTDIGHGLDGLSNAPGGGTQLHLGAGTISSGPAPDQGAQGPHHGGARSHEQPNPQRNPASGAATEGRDERTEDREPTDSAATADPESERPSDEAESDPSEADGSDSPEPEVDDPESDRSESSGADRTDDTDEHPLADRNRGRFVTSPDRTPWYATPLDREAIAQSGPVIAGELEAGEAATSDDTDGERTRVEDHSDDPIVAPPVETSPTDGPDDGASDNTAVNETDPTERERTDDTTGAERAPTGNEPDDPDSIADEPTSAEVTDGNPDSDDLSQERSADRSNAVPTPSESVDESLEDDSTISFDEHDVIDATTIEFDSDVSEYVEPESEEADAEIPDPEPADDEPDHESALEPRTDDALDGPETDPADRSNDGPPRSSDGDVSRQSQEDEFESFEFPDSDFEPDERTVDEAVDDLNEDAPAPSLSSHGFEVSAETADDGAVLTFELDTETVDVSGSTKRLLQYQLRSFADRDSTPDADVTIDRHRIVVDLPEADGAAISKWGEAVVSVVDRTLYLSDNSG